MLCGHAAVEAFYILVQNKRTNKMLHITLSIYLPSFLLTGHAWMQFLILKDVLKVPQVRRSLWWGEDTLWKLTRRRKTKQLDCVFINCYFRLIYEQQFSILQILHGRRLWQWWFTFCQIFISTQHTCPKYCFELLI